MKTYRWPCLAVTLGVSGCVTMATQVMPEEVCSYAAEHQDRWGCGDTSRIYSGAKADLCLVSSDVLLGLWAFLDLPLSLVADTLILPVTAYQQASRGDLCEENSSAPQQGS